MKDLIPPPAQLQHARATLPTGNIVRRPNAPITTPRPIRQKVREMLTVADLLDGECRALSDTIHTRLEQEDIARRDAKRLRLEVEKFPAKTHTRAKVEEQLTAATERVEFTRAELQRLNTTMTERARLRQQAREAAMRILAALPDGGTMETHNREVDHR